MAGLPAVVAIEWNQPYLLQRNVAVHTQNEGISKVRTRDKYTQNEGISKVRTKG